MKSGGQERAREALVRGTEALRDELPPVATLFGFPIIVDELMVPGAIVFGRYGVGADGVVLIGRGAPLPG